MSEQISDHHQCPDDPFGALAELKVILEKARKRTIHELLDTEQPGSQALDCLDRIKSLQKQTPGYADAMLRSAGTCRKIL